MAWRSDSDAMSTGTPSYVPVLPPYVPQLLYGQDMSDPTVNVQKTLLPHIHLAVAQNVPLVLTGISIEAALDQLLKAPQLVRNKPVAWQYWHTPNDGTVYIVWQPRLLGDNFSSDGYIWHKPERVNNNQIHNYIVQTFVAEAGYSPGREQLTCHRRVRYRIIGSPNNQHDQQLELVHYCAAPMSHQYRADTIPLTKPISDAMTERHFLEKQGGLPRKEFMLHDKSNYPHIVAPQPQIPGNPYAAQPYGRSGMGPTRSQQPMPTARGGPMGPSPNKRPTTAGQRGPVNSFQAAKTPIPEVLKDEDSHLYGDALDHLTPKEISATRYKQHHEWMDEILTSPYAVNQIIPPALGLKLGGNLSHLTDGLWEDGKDREDDGINAESIKEFESRVTDLMKKAEAELDGWDKAHSAFVAEFKTPSVWDTLERELAKNGDSAGVDRVMQKCISTTGYIFKDPDQLQPVRKGGILEKGQENLLANSQAAHIQDETFDFMDDINTAGEGLDAFITYDDDGDMAL